MGWVRNESKSSELSYGEIRLDFFGAATLAITSRKDTGIQMKTIRWRLWCMAVLGGPFIGRHLFDGLP
jgi:hypothetical protein